MTASDRLQSQTFVNGLGRRLLSMVGIEPSSPNVTEPLASNAEGDAPSAARSGSADETMKALQNSTVLQKLRGGVHSIYGGLSKMYNSTVQQQLEMLRERFKKEAENSTNPWQQRMAQQVPMFFNSVAKRVDDAQENLNRIWRQVTQSNNATITDQSQPPTTRSSSGLFDQFMNPYEDGSMFQPGRFFDQVGRSFGFNGGPQPRQDTMDPQQRGFGDQLMNLWHNQIQPQVSMVRGQIANVWRDMTSNGLLTPMNNIIRSRSNGNNLGASSQNDSSTPDLVDDILKSVDMNSPEYTLIEPKSGDQQQAGSQQQSNNVPMSMGAQVQNRLIAMQREINQLWNGLSSSLQGALSNVRNSMNPRPAQFSPLDTMASNNNNNNNNKQEVDPAENEIDGKLKDLTKLQRDADTVYNVVQQQQQAQQRPVFGDRFKNFFNNMDFSSADQFPGRFTETVSRFGNVVGDLWNQIPERWDNFMHNNMQRQDAQPKPANAAG